MNPAFWNGRRVFVTGHTGFKGAWLSLWLQQMGAVVHGYALAPDGPDAMFHVADIAQGMTHALGDIRDAAHLAESLRKFAPEIVIHLTAQSLVRCSYSNPVETYAVNVMGTVHVLDAVRRAGPVSATLIVTSDKCYENDESGRPFLEDDPMGGQDPYSSSKGCAELLTAAYCRSFRDALGSVATVRAGNAVGGGDWSADRILPDTFRAFLAGNRVALRNPDAIRPWQHVLEPLAGYLLAAEFLAATQLRAPQCWNFGPDPNGEATVAYVAARCCALWGQPEALSINAGNKEFHEASILRLDSSKARRELHWRSRWTLDETLVETVRWYKAMADGADMRQFTLKQIASYLEPRHPAAPSDRP